MSTYQEFANALLCALAEATDNQGGGKFNLGKLAGAKDLHWKLDWLDCAVDTFETKDWIKLYPTKTNPNALAEITNTGRQQVFRILEGKETEYLSYNPRYELDRFDWFLLGVMFRAAYKNETEGYLFPESFRHWDPRKSSIEAICDRLDAMENVQLVISQSPPLGPFEAEEKMYRITTLGSHFLAQNDKYFFEQQYGLTEDIPEELCETLERFDAELHMLNVRLSTYVETDIVPAANRTVSLDHNSAAYKDTVQKIYIAIKVIQESNSEVQYDKEQIISEISAGQKLLQSTMVRVAAAAAVLLSPLYTVYHDAAAAALKPYVLNAINAITALLGI